MVLVNDREPLVSVVITTYNRQAYLKEAIASVLQQTYKNIEVIIADNGSTESPKALVDAFQDSRLHLRINEKNIGIGPNFTSAFKLAKGKYVASINDDDLWQKDILEKLVPLLENNPEVVVAFCDYYVINSEGVVNDQLTEEQTKREKRTQLKAGIYQPYHKLALIDKSIFSALANVIRRDAVDWDKLAKEGAESSVFCDFYMTYLACRSGKAAYYCPEKLAFYRVHDRTETMISGNKNAEAKIRKGKAAIFCYKTFSEDPLLQEFKPYFEKELAHYNTTLAIGLLRVGQVTEARPYLFNAIAKQKFNLRTLVALTLSYIPQLIARNFLGGVK
ncbi:MAG: glycosyltransferase [Chroococcus sp. CMT-3BRIN-NPC107]|jgi:glycosyltransferase domain-containing protein|nr:glycosyltransferase [Chroococcus sp. CMT-3BRIN-NPC107]